MTPDSSWRGPAWATILTIALFLGSMLSARAQSVAPSCDVPARLARLDQPLWRVAQHVADRLPLKIVTIGSSSTAGAGASSPDASYPARLAADLKRLFPMTPVAVVNRGVNGSEVADMMARFSADVLAEKPDLVIWQFGTNALLRDMDIEPLEDQIATTIRSLRADGVDVVLLDSQYAPRVVAKGDVEQKMNWMARIARKAQVGVFRRFSVMRHWNHDRNLAFDQFVTADGLHMNDWGYDCVARLMANSIADAASRGAEIAHAHGGLLR